METECLAQSEFQWQDKTHIHGSAILLSRFPCWHHLNNAYGFPVAFSHDTAKDLYIADHAGLADDKTDVHGSLDPHSSGVGRILHIRLDKGHHRLVTSRVFRLLIDYSEQFIVGLDHFGYGFVEDHLCRSLYLLWDNQNMRVTNYDEANQFVKRDYREGWTLGV